MITAALAEIERAHTDKEVKEITEVNLRDEKEAIIFYKWIHHKVRGYKTELQDAFERLEGGILNIIHDEQKYLKHLALLVQRLEETVEKKKQNRCPNT